MLQHTLQKGQREGRRFTRTGLRRAHHIAALQHDGDGLRLDRRHRRITQLGHSAGQGLGQLELRERIQARSLGERGGCDMPCGNSGNGSIAGVV